jgi:hypothetical protein
MTGENRRQIAVNQMLAEFPRSRTRNIDNNKSASCFGRRDGVHNGRKSGDKWRQGISQRAARDPAMEKSGFSDPVGPTDARFERRRLGEDRLSETRGDELFK